MRNSVRCSPRVSTPSGGDSGTTGGLLGWRPAASAPPTTPRVRASSSVTAAGGLRSHSTTTARSAEQRGNTVSNRAHVASSTCGPWSSSTSSCGPTRNRVPPATCSSTTRSSGKASSSASGRDPRACWAMTRCARSSSRPQSAASARAANVSSGCRSPTSTCAGGFSGSTSRPVTSRIRRTASAIACTLAQQLTGGSSVPWPRSRGPTCHRPASPQIQAAPAARAPAAVSRSQSSSTSSGSSRFTSRKCQVVGHPRATHASASASSPRARSTPSSRKSTPPCASRNATGSRPWTAAPYSVEIPTPSRGSAATRSSNRAMPPPLARRGYPAAPQEVP